MTPAPHAYEAALRWTGGKTGVLTAPPRPDLTGGSPPEFGGTDQVWSPEHLLLSSASLCLMLTFLALAERAKLPVDGYACKTEGTLGKTDHGLAFSRIVIRVELKSPELERAEAMLQTAKKYCIISSSLKAPVEVEAIRPAPGS